MIQEFSLCLVNLVRLYKNDTCLADYLNWLTMDIYVQVAVSVVRSYGVTFVTRDRDCIQSIMCVPKGNKIEKKECLHILILFCLKFIIVQPLLYWVRLSCQHHFNLTKACPDLPDKNLLTSRQLCQVTPVYKFVQLWATVWYSVGTQNPPCVFCVLFLIGKVYLATLSIWSLDS